MQVNQMPPMTIETRMKVLNIIWIALMGSVLALGFIVFNLPPPPPDATPVDHSVFMQMLGGVAVAAAIASFLLPGYLLKLRPANATAASKDPEFLALSAYFVAFLVQQALRESVATLGFVLVVTTHNKDLFLYFGGASLLLQLIGKPSVEKIREIAQSARMPNRPS